MGRADSTQLCVDLPILTGLSSRERRAVSRLGTRVEVPKGKVLTREGEPGREVMLIASGTARVERGGRRVTTLGPGAIFGELALLTGARRAAVVTAESEMVIEALNRQEFATLLDTSPEMTKRILVGAIRRLQENAG